MNTHAHYLGVLLRNNLKWDTHVDQVANKARRILGLLKHTLADVPQEVKIQAYKTLCRSVPEYASPVWDPEQLGLSQKIEIIHNKAMRFILNIKGQKEYDICS